jgi:hypothetical protein
MNYRHLARANRIARETFRNYHGKYPEHMSDEEKSHFGYAIQPFYGNGAYRKTRVFCSSPYCCGNLRRSKLAEKDRIPIRELRWRGVE